MKLSRSVRHCSLRRVMLFAESPDSLPKDPSKAGAKSPLESPCKYGRGKTSETFGERRMYGGSMELEKRLLRPSSSLLRSSTLGARTFTAPAPTTTSRSLARPFLATRAYPLWSRSLLAASTYSSTSASRASMSILLAP